MKYWKENINYRQEKNADCIRYLITIDGKEHEVDEALYREYTRMERRERYLIERDAGVCLSLEQLPGRGAYIPDDEAKSADDILIQKEEEAKRKALLARLPIVLGQLDEQELAIISALYLNGRSERDVARELNVSQPAIHKRQARILKKLSNLFDS